MTVYYRCPVVQSRKRYAQGSPMADIAGLTDVLMLARAFRALDMLMRKSLL